MPTNPERGPATETSKMEDPKECQQHDAILLSLSAIAFMADHPYHMWMSYRQRLALAERRKDQAEIDHCTRYMGRDSRMVGLVCEKLDEAMQLLGDHLNGCDAVDEHGNLDAAFAAMDRAMGRDGSREDGGR